MTHQIKIKYCKC